MMQNTWHFAAMDSLFFRDSRPMNAGESAWIESMFPPTGHTLQGAIRTAILSHLDADFQAFQNGEPCLPDGGSLKQALGDKDSLGKLSLSGPLLCQDGVPLYPVPLDLIKRKAQSDFDLLRPSDEAVTCDLGNIRLPVTNGSGLKALEGTFISQEGMQLLLAGNATSKLQDSLYPLIGEQYEQNKPSLAYREPKMGLARDKKSRMAEEGMLYAIAPVRPRAGLTIAIQVTGVNTEHFPQTPLIQRLGGEGKLAHITITTPPPLPDKSFREENGRLFFKLVLITPARMPNAGWLPNGFTPVENTTHSWDGTLEYSHAGNSDEEDDQPSQCAVRFNIISACIGKALKIGGWNHGRHHSKPVKSYVPAGSVYFCEADATQQHNVEQLHGAKIGSETEYGFGQVLVGTW